MREEYLSQEELSIIEESMEEALKPIETVYNPSKNEEVIKKIEEKIGYRDKRENYTDSNSFDNTQRNRKFFEIQPGKGSAKRETYWNTLFFLYNTKATREFAKKILDNKTIVLLGGGRSQLKQEFKEHDIIPRDIINVDPFVDNIEEAADPVILINAADKNFIEKMHLQGIDGADEIWAEFSVPAYLDDPEEIKQLMQNIDLLLVPGGTARIWPIKVSGEGENLDQIARKNALMDSIKDIIKTNKYEFILYESAGHSGLIFHKLAPSTKDLQNIQDQNQIKKTRDELFEMY